MRYLKTYFSAPYEMKFLRLNFLESLGHIDNFILCEFNRTHTGAPRELIWDRLKHDYFSEEELKKITYIGADVSKLTGHSSSDGNIIHQNEDLMRGYFMSQMDLKSSDVIISVDADEIIFGDSYEKVIPGIKFLTRGFVLNLYLFIYRINYLWKDESFYAPVMCRADYYGRQYPAGWRYKGRKARGMHGCHFTWCMSLDEMVEKLKRYAHAQEYSRFADPVILRKAIEEKKYPFDPERRFELKVIDMEKERQFFPPSIYGMSAEFSGLIATT